MARLPAFVDALARTDRERDRSTIDSIARTVREDGLLPTISSGRGAAHLTAENVADLLIAVHAVAPRAKASQAARQIRSLRRETSSSKGKNGFYKSLGDADTFGDALVVLIEQAAAISESFVGWVDDAYANIPEEDRHIFLPKLRVRFTNRLTADISFLFNRGVERTLEAGTQVEFKTSYMIDLDRPREFYKTVDTDREISVSVGLATIMFLHDTLFEIEEKTEG